MNLLSILYNHQKRTPDKIAYRFLNNTSSVDVLTYKELYRAAVNIAYTFKNMGAQKNDRVLIILPQQLQYLLVFFGGMFADLILVPLFPPKKQSELDTVISIINDSSATFIVGNEEDLCKIAHIQEIRINNTQLVEMSVLIENSRNQDREWYINDNTTQIAFLQYTSGSTNTPKGVMVGHDNLMANFEMMKQGFNLNQSSIIVSWLPFFHDMGLIGNVLVSIYCNAEAILMTPFQFVKRPLFWLETITKYKCTHSGGPNFAYDLCINSTYKNPIPPLDLSSWVFALNGAEPVRPNTIKKFIEIFGQYGFNPNSYYPAYGMAEATLYISGNKVNTPVKYAVVDIEEIKKGYIKNSALKAKEIVSCGKTRLDAQILIVDPESHYEKQINEVGEIWLMGSNVTHGYWNRPELTKLIFQAFTVNTQKGPALRTGDLGYLDEEGNVYIISRIKDVIIIHGKNYAPQDIEMSVEKVTQLRQSNFVAAFSIDISQSEELILVIEVRNISIEIINHIKTEVKKAIVAEHSLVPFDIVFVKYGGIPKTTSGKLKRSLCKELYLKNKLPLYQV